MVRASCLCGDVAYEVEGAFTDMSHCHCGMCRKHHGSVFATYMTVSVEGFRWLTDTDGIGRYESSPEVVRAFCKRCGSVVPPPNVAGKTTFVPVGNFEKDCGARPDCHIFVASKAPWYTITDDLPQYDEYDPGSSSPTIAQPDRSSTDTSVKRGSCLCDRVAFQYSGDPLMVMNCHCSRCRRARSAAHATNVFVNLDNFEWLRGEDEITDFPLPGAKRFGQAFCQTCGSSVPRVLKALDRVNVPAGILDDAPGAMPKAHIYLGSKAPWFEATDDLPKYDELPPS